MKIPVPNIFAARSSLPKFANFAQIASVMSQGKTPEQMQQQFMNDLQQAEIVSPQDATVKQANSSSSFSVDIPNLTTIPPSTATLEMGCATVSGNGNFNIGFTKTYQNAPYTMITAFGFYQIQFPTGIVLDWSTYGIGFAHITLPSGLSLKWTTLRLPVMTFMLGTYTDHVQVYNVAGDATVIYMAFGE